MMQQTTVMKTTATADKVWEVFAHQFDDGYKWMSSVPKSYAIAEDSGEKLEGAKTIGRIVEMQPDGSGMKATERFTAYDEAAKTCTVRVDFIDAPGMLPLNFNTLDFSVVDDSDGGSTATWVFGADIKRWAYLMWPLLRFGMGKAWTEMSEEFRHYAETGTPHTRKVAAIEKANAEQVES